MNAIAIVMAWLMAVLALPASASSQPPAGSSGNGTTMQKADPVLAYADRLAALEPAHPRMYFELAEEIAAEVRSAEGQETARRLYILAILAPHHTDHPHPLDESASPAWLASSASLGLAALAQNEQERRWLTALAGTLAPAETTPRFQQGTETASRDSAALELATALGMVRSGDGRRAQKILDKPAVASLLARYEGLLNPGGLSGGAGRIRSLAATFPVCPECRNRRYVKNADGVHLCPTCQGRPGPKLSTQELIGQLRLESLLLNGIQRSWAAQVVADGGAPMRELDVEVLADVYGVDPAKPYWRAGAWVGDPIAPAAPAPAVPSNPSSTPPVAPRLPPLPPADDTTSRRQPPA